jgi:uncharacterized protein YndB with AHSA1/START domain
MTARKRITMEREFDAPVEELWALWTTKEGIESWWGPDGFRVEVQSLDLRPGGQMVYAMIAVDADKIAFMKESEMPTSTVTRITFREIVPNRRLAYVNHADFIPGVQPYEVAQVVEMESTKKGSRMVLSFEAMHDETWTRRATMGWEMELRKLEKRLAKQGGA